MTNEELAREVAKDGYLPKAWEVMSEGQKQYCVNGILEALNKATEPLQNELGVLDAELIVAKSENTQLQTNLHAIETDLSLSIGERNRLFAELTQLKADCEVMREVLKQYAAYQGETVEDCPLVTIKGSFDAVAEYVCKRNEQSQYGNNPSWRVTPINDAAKILSTPHPGQSLVEKEVK